MSTSLATGLPPSCRSYSPFLQTLYDQSAPVGRQFTHYTVLRAPVAVDAALQALELGGIVDFAVIWDEDHDERVIAVVHRLLFAGLLSTVRFIEERKGALTVILDPTAPSSTVTPRITELGRWVNGDSWTVNVIVDTDPSVPRVERHDRFLAHIQDMWELGVRMGKHAVPELLGFEKTESDSGKMEKRLVDVGLANRTVNVLAVNGIYTVGDLVQQSKRSLQTLPQMGRATLYDIVASLDRLGLSLKV